MGAAVVPEGHSGMLGMACRCIWLFLLLLSHKMCLLLDAPVLDITDQLPELATFKEQHPELAETGILSLQ